MSDYIFIFYPFFLLLLVVKIIKHFFFFYQTNSLSHYNSNFFFFQGYEYTGIIFMTTTNQQFLSKTSEAFRVSKGTPGFLELPFTTCQH